MRARFAVRALPAVCAAIALSLVAELRAQNPFAPTTPPAGAPAAAAPTTPAAPGAPTSPAAPAANPFAPTTPAAKTPAATTPAMPAAPAANPFGTPAPTATPTSPLTPVPDPNAPAGDDGPSGLPVVPVQGPPPPGGYRALAPGVLTTIPSPVSVEDLQSTHDLVEILAELPTYGERAESPNRKPARNIRFDHDAWGLDFTFKPVRFIRLKGKDGAERLIWYLVYNVRNGPVKKTVYDQTQPNQIREEPVTKPFFFVPRFELESYDVNKVYNEKIIPEAVAAIQQREDKNRKLLTTGQMTGEIPVSTKEVNQEVWGVATWEGIDPRTDRFSIHVHGLTNAYRWVDAEGAYKPGDPIGTGRTYQYQVLKLNFWRPSDTKYEHEEEIRFGIPGEVDYSWSYR